MESLNICILLQRHFEEAPIVNAANLKPLYKDKVRMFATLKSHAFQFNKMFSKRVLVGYACPPMVQPSRLRENAVPRSWSP